jgi:hypothetical protein
MRVFLPVLVAVACFAAPAAAQSPARPAPVRPFVVGELSNQEVRVRLRQDRCFTWGAPAVTRSGNTFAITQTVGRRDQCQEGGTGFGEVRLDPLPAGEYRVNYSPSSIDVPAIASHTVDFVVRERNTQGIAIDVALEPGFPTALEPITAVIGFNVCERVTGFRIRGDALEVTSAGEFGSGWCDYERPNEVEIGAYPPGTYTLRVVRTTATGELVLATRTFTVAPRRSSSEQSSEYVQDLSGIWFSPDEEPGTAIAFINSTDPNADGFVYNGLTGIWYRYGADGQAAWYLLELSVGDGLMGNVTFDGFAYRYAATDPGAPGFQRSLSRTQVGAVSLQVGGQSRELLLRGTVDGSAVDIPFRPFRWTRNAWSRGN